MEGVYLARKSLSWVFLIDSVTFRYKPISANLCHLFIKINVRPTYAYIDDSYKNYLLESYEDTFMPDGVENVGRAVLCWTKSSNDTESDVCVFYYKEKYLPEQRKQSKRNLFYHQPKSGTKVAYEYAIRRGKRIINLVSNNSNLKKF